ncbi:cysteine hydrolase, partial [Rhizobium johnstonii]
MEQKMSGPDTVLLVIDAPESFRHRDYWDENLASAYIDRPQTLIDGAQVDGIPIIQICHVDENGPFSEAAGFVSTLAPLRIAP